MNIPAALRFSRRPAELPGDAPRFSPLVQTVSVAILVGKVPVLGVIALIWAVDNMLGLPAIVTIVLSVLSTLVMLLLAMPALRRLYWDEQRTAIEERANPPSRISTDVR